MKTQILDKDFNVVAEREFKHHAKVNVTSAHVIGRSLENVAPKMFIGSLSN